MLGAVIFTLRVLLPVMSGWGIIGAAAALCLACFFVGGGGFKGARNILFAVLIASVASSSLLYAVGTEKKSLSALEYADGESREVKATVTEVAFRGAYSASYRVTVNEVDGEKTDFPSVLECDFHASFEWGDVICFDGVFEQAEADAAYLKSDGIFVRISAEDAQRRGRVEKGVSYHLNVLNNKLAERMVDMMGEKSGGFCAAIILGNRKHVDSGMRLDFSRIGISHLLALSGLHLSVIVQTLDFILRGFMKKKPRNILLIAAVFAFAVFTGLSVSVLRAAVMLAFVFAADMVGEENDSLTALFAAVWVILIVNGNAVYDVAFWLSVCATLGIILTRPAADALFAKWKKPKKNKALRALHGAAKYFYGILVMSAAATFFTLPVIAFAFGEISLIGMLSNFVFLPLATVLIILCALLVPMSFIPYAGEAMALCCKTVAEITIDAAEYFSDFRGIFVSIKYPFSPYVFGILAMTLFGCIFVKKLSALKISALVISFAVAFSACLGIYSIKTNGDVRVKLFSDGTREYVTMDADGENYVFDVSTGGYSFMYEEVYSVKELGYTEVDNLVLTHYHNYHQNSIYRLNDMIKIRNVMLPEPQTEDEREDFEAIVDTLDSCGISYGVYARGERYERGGVSILFAPLYKLPRSAKPIVAFCIEMGENSFSYIESAAFEASFDYTEFCSADAVYVGAHGPARKFPFSARALKDADRVIFSCGAKGYFTDTEYLAEIYEISNFNGEMTVLYDF